jgi:hypothetical protein
VRVDYTHEGYAIPINPPSPAKTRNQAGLTLGDAFMHKVGKGTVITQSSFFYPDLSQTGEYRGTFNFSTVTLSSTSGWGGRTRSEMSMSATLRPERKRMTCRLRRG